jgi:hypothetical protein
MSMRPCWQFIALLFAAIPLAGVARAQAVLTESGSISGVREGGVSVYKGVPFAAPPLGDPIVVGGVANISGLSVLDAVYTSVRGRPFAGP